MCHILAYRLIVIYEHYYNFHNIRFEKITALKRHLSNTAENRSFLFDSKSVNRTKYKHGRNTKGNKPGAAPQDEIMSICKLKGGALPFCHLSRPE